ncbi:hypothetical protein GGS26DRAFT_387621 [Hypomontagnella submonticulosa]|nr:hypothetical protein GGS26DRAFT_387621 [Hypomontagnella submonticulosa]
MPLRPGNPGKDFPCYLVTLHVTFHATLFFYHCLQGITVRYRTYNPNYQASSPPFVFSFPETLWLGLCQAVAYSVPLLDLRRYAIRIGNLGGPYKLLFTGTYPSGPRLLWGSAYYYWIPALLEIFVEPDLTISHRPLGPKRMVYSSSMGLIRSI